MDIDHVWSHLGAAQALGKACVICGRAMSSSADGGGPGRPGDAHPASRAVRGAVAVGRYRNGATVYACAEPCSGHAAMIVRHARQDWQGLGPTERRGE